MEVPKRSMGAVIQKEWAASIGGQQVDTRLPAAHSGTIQIDPLEQAVLNIPNRSVINLTLQIKWHSLGTFGVQRQSSLIDSSGILSTPFLQTLYTPHPKILSPVEFPHPPGLDPQRPHAEAGRQDKHWTHEHSPF